VDLLITADLRSPYRVWLGQLPVTAAIREGRLTFDGPTALTTRMPSVLRLSPIAGTVATAR